MLKKCRFADKFLRPGLFFLAGVTLLSLLMSSCAPARRMESASGQYEPEDSSAVEEETAVLTEEEATRTVQKVLLALPENLIQFFPPPTLTVGEKTRVEARVARTLLENLNQGLLAKEWKVDALVGARLSGDAFEFHTMGPEDQMVGSQEFTTWSWDVLPLTAGAQVMKMNMTFRIVTADGTQVKATPVLEKPVQTVEKQTGGFMKFLQNYWAWILGLVLVVGIVAILVIEPSGKKS